MSFSLNVGSTLFQLFIYQVIYGQKDFYLKQDSLISSEPI